MCYGITVLNTLRRNNADVVSHIPSLMNVMAYPYRHGYDVMMTQIFNPSSNDMLQRKGDGDVTPKNGVFSLRDWPGLVGNYNQFKALLPMQAK
ncbi:hypothetical protein Tco_1211152 [Tanacetum coccineum]